VAKNRKHTLFLILMATLILINGCGTGDWARNAMEASKAAYERCLEQNPGDHSKCESLKRIYEANLKAYRESSKGGGPTTTIRFGIGSEN
jgi:hypothetical protein